MSKPSWRTDKQRNSSAEGYGWAWRKARAVFLQQHPLCEMCGKLKPPRVTAAAVVDHRVPHRGDQRLFWDQSNWQALCKLCHDSHKQAMERSGQAPQVIGLDGFPIEPDSEEPVRPGGARTP
jgi:5-methylcytosine-specific restriction enzyme A